MFGMGFMEIMIIAIIAIIFLGPEKLPETLINIAKFFRSFKATITDAKSTLEQELNISELKKEALGFKNELTSTTSEIERIKDMANLDLPELDDFKPGISPIPTAQTDTVEEEPKEKEVTFKKKKKKKKVVEEEPEIKTEDKD